MLIAVLIGIPCIAAGWYYFPKDIYVYVFAENDATSVVVRLNGETVIDEAAPVHREDAQLPLCMAKKTVAGPDIELYVRAPGSYAGHYRTPLQERFSTFQGTHFHIFIQDTIFIGQMTNGPYLQK